MRIKFLIAALLLAGAFLKGGAIKAQGVADSLLYRQAKLEIWCETMEFIYEDYGADSLKESLQCQDWTAFENSMLPNHLQTRSFFQAIEKPSIYSGYTTYQAKLQKLVEEISKKLKSSPSRAVDQSRIRKVDSLQASLLALAAAPTSVLSVQSDTGVATDIDTDTDAGTAEALSENTEMNTNDAVSQEAAEDPNFLEEDQMDWTEIFQWILLILLTAGMLVLWGQNRKLKNELELRMNRRKQEISAISQIRQSEKPENIKPKAVNEPKALTQAEVIRLIRAEIEKAREQQKARRLEQSAAEKQAGSRSKQQQASPARPTPAQPAPDRAAPSTSSAPQGAKAPARSEIRKEAAEAKEGAKNGHGGVLYDKLPFKGGFHQNHLSPQRHPDSIYSIQIRADKPDEAEFWVTEDQEVQKYAMQNGLSFFEEACEYSQVEENPSRVRNLERGRLRKSGHLWEIDKKVKVSFE